MGRYNKFGNWSVSWGGGKSNKIEKNICAKLNYELNNSWEKFEIDNWRRNSKKILKALKRSLINAGILIFLVVHAEYGFPYPAPILNNFWNLLHNTIQVVKQTQTPDFPPLENGNKAISNQILGSSVRKLKQTESVVKWSLD